MAINLRALHNLDTIKGELDDKVTVGLRILPPNQGTSYTADRTIMRKLLLRGLDKQVSYGKKVISYPSKDAISIVVCFADETSALGFLLVGADRINSVIREQYLPGLQTFLDTENSCIFDQTPLIHAMPPTGAVGANTAIRDAANLVQALVEGAVTKELIQMYEQDVRVRAYESITRSAEGSQKLLGMKDVNTLKEMQRREAPKADARISFIVVDGQKEYMMLSIAPWV